MSEPINLNRVRKERARAEAQQQALENAEKFGRTKAQKVLEATRSERARKMLDQHKNDEDE